MKSGLLRGAWEGWLDDGDNGGGEPRSPRPPARTATNDLKGPPPRVAPLQPGSGTPGGKQRGPSSAHAAVRAPDRREAGQLQRLPSWHVGISLWGEGSAEPGPRVSALLLPPGRRARGWPGPIGDVLTWGSAAGTRAHPARPPTLPPSPRQPPPPAQHHVGRRSQSRARWARSIPGGTAGAWGMQEANFPGAEVKPSCPLRVARRVSGSRVLPSTTTIVRAFISTSRGPGFVPSSGDEPQQAQAPASGAGCIPGKTRKRRLTIQCSREKMGFVIFHFTGVTQ